MADARTVGVQTTLAPLNVKAWKFRKMVKILMFVTLFIPLGKWEIWGRR